MAGEIIRLGDPTSHGGTVIEGSPTDICLGKPIAFMGHKTYCPDCKGTFPIIEGVQTTTFYGKGVALAGMRTSCGAILFATQFTDTVEYGNGGGGGAPQSLKSRPDTITPATAPTALTTTFGSTTSAPRVSEDIHADHKYDLVFHVRDAATGKALAHTCYRITLDDGTEFVGTTDASGMTEKACSDHPQNATIEVPFYDHDSSPDTDHEHYACYC